MFLKMFECDVKNTSYIRPIIKIAVVIGLDCLCFFCKHLICTNSKAVSAILTVVTMALCSIGIFVVYISIAEIAYAVKNRRPLPDTKKLLTKGKMYPIETIASIAEQNDIVDITILNDDTVTSIGASSDCKNSNSIFFDKQYYVADTVFNDFCEFRNALPALSTDGVSLCVLRID